MEKTNDRIRLVKVHKSFGTQKVLDGVDLNIPGGSITVILGRSGEGKSVLLKHLIGLLKADSGQVFVDGLDISGMGSRDLNEIRKRFGMLFQNGALFDSLNVHDNVAFPLKEHTPLSSSEIRRIVDEKLALVGLKDVCHKMPCDLSGGMRKRVALARAITLSPEIILYDEPTTGLDPLMTDSVNNLILDMQKKLKVTSVIISHDIESTFRLADKIAMLHDGKIIAEGSPETFKMARHPFVQHFLEGRSENEVIL